MAMKLVKPFAGLQVDSVARVSIVSYRGKTRVLVSVDYAPFSEEGAESFLTESFSFPVELDPQPQVANAIARGYELLKTLPEFADAEDV